MKTAFQFEKDAGLVPDSKKLRIAYLGFRELGYSKSGQTLREAKIKCLTSLIMRLEIELEKARRMHKRLRRKG